MVPPLWVAGLNTGDCGRPFPCKHFARCNGRYRPGFMLSAKRLPGDVRRLRPREAFTRWPLFSAGTGCLLLLFYIIAAIVDEPIRRVKCKQPLVLSQVPLREITRRLRVREANEQCAAACRGRDGGYRSRANGGSVSYRSLRNTCNPRRYNLVMADFARLQGADTEGAGGRLGVSEISGTSECRND